MTDLIQTVLRRSTSDRALRRLALSDAAAALQSVAGPDASLSDSVPVVFVEENHAASEEKAGDDVTVFVLPAYGGDPLDIEALDAVAGGTETIDSPLCLPDPFGTGGK